MINQTRTHQLVKVCYFENVLLPNPISDLNFSHGKFSCSVGLSKIYLPGVENGEGQRLLLFDISKVYLPATGISPHNISIGTTLETCDAANCHIQNVQSQKHAAVCSVSKSFHRQKGTRRTFPVPSIKIAEGSGFS